LISRVINPANEPVAKLRLSAFGRESGPGISIVASFPLEPVFPLFPS